MPSTKGQMDELGKESITPAPSAMEASSLSDGRSPAPWALPQKKNFYPPNRLCQKK